MEALGAILTILGAVISIAGYIWFLVVAFQESIVWGLLCLFLPIVSLVFLIMNWAKAWRPFVLQLAGGAVILIGAVLAASQQTPTP